MKTWVIKVTICNSGIDSDDVDFVKLYTEDIVTRDYLLRVLDTTDKLLRKEDKNGWCLYKDIGYNSCAFMDEVCLSNSWNWEYFAPDISFDIA